jgi:gliding motility-associated-like protein
LKYQLILANFLKSLIGVLILPLVGLAQCDPITTPFSQNNTQDGIMFDIEAINDVTINEFSANLCDAGPYDMEIYYKAGTHFGFEANAGAWTLIGGTTGLASAGTDVPTFIPINVNIAIPAGQRYAFYVTESANSANNMCYTDGLSPNPSALATNLAVLADANIIVYEGTGKDYAFGADYYPRMPNFITDYDCCPPPDTLVTGNSCSGMADGSVEATGNGVGPWVYEISDISGVLETSAPLNGPYTFTALIEGMYTISVTDDAGCTAGVLAEVEPALPIVIDAVITDNQCFGGTVGDASITVAGGTAPFDVEWTDAFGNTLQSNPQINGAAMLDSLSAGSYLITADDATGCSVTSSITVTEPLTPLQLYLSPVNLNCFESADGEVGVSQSGVPPYFFEISDVFGLPVQSISSPSDYTFIDLEAGILFVTATDANGCSITDDVELFQPDIIEIETVTTPVLCFNGNEGTASITSVIGGTTPYGITSWNDPASQTGNAVIDLSPGIYTASVLDANGCELDVELEFDNPSSMLLAPRYLTDTCGQGLGAAIVDVELGTPPYTFLWKDNGVTSGVNYELGVGSYEVVVTDANGCQDSVFSPVLDDLPYPSASFDYRIEGETLIDQEVQFLNNPNGTTQWTWFFGNGESSNERDPRFKYDRAGDYLVALLASNGFCVDTAYRYVNIDPMLLVYVPNAFTPGINGINDFFFPQGEGIELESYDMEIYDRWGKVVWYTGEYSKKWDGRNKNTGKEAPVGTYAYRITFREFADLDRHTVKGIVNLIRD